jgi:hypothetical protein
VTPPSYSHRFLNAGPGIGTYRAAVPAGYRGVVLFIAHTNYAAATVGMSCKIAGKPFFYSELPGSTYNRFAAVRGTVYSGEEIEVVLDHENTYGHVSGFLFVEVARAIDFEESYTAEISPPEPDVGKRDLA